MNNSQLGICIPTYNRAKVLESLLLDLIPQVSLYHIPIYICDNNSSDTTYAVVAKAKEKYEFIFYHQNKNNLGADKNFENVLKMSQCSYSWLLGDDDKIIAGGIPMILQIINYKKFDAIVTNGSNDDGKILKCKNIKSAEYTEHNALMSDLWHTMTWMSTLIYSHDLIESGNFKKYYNTNFLQSAVIFDYLATKSSFSVYWNEQPLVIYPEEENIINHYTDKIIFLFLYSWVNVILSLPSMYRESTKQKCIQDSPIQAKTLIYLRMKKTFNFYEFKKYRQYFKYITKIPSAFLFFISICPPFLFRVLYIIKKSIG